MMPKKSMLVAVVSAVILAGPGVSAAFAGEITGNGSRPQASQMQTQSVSSPGRTTTRPASIPSRTAHQGSRSPTGRRTSWVW